jgi:hypothetical protein
MMMCYDEESKNPALSTVHAAQQYSNNNNNHTPIKLIRAEVFTSRHKGKKERRKNCLSSIQSSLFRIRISSIINITIMTDLKDYQTDCSYSSSRLAAEFTSSRGGGRPGCFLVVAAAVAAAEHHHHDYSVTTNNNNDNDNSHGNSNHRQ